MARKSPPPRSGKGANRLATAAPQQIAQLGGIERKKVSPSGAFLQSLRKRLHGAQFAAARCRQAVAKYPEAAPSLRRAALRYDGLAAELRRAGA